MAENVDLSQLKNCEAKKIESKIIVNRLPMNQVQFHETFQLVSKRATLDMVANRLHNSKDTVSQSFFIFLLEN